MRLIELLLFLKFDHLRRRGNNNNKHHINNPLCIFTIYVIVIAQPATLTSDMFYFVVCSALIYSEKKILLHDVVQLISMYVDTSKHTKPLTDTAC